MSEEKTEHKNAPSRRSGTPGLADLAKELWDLHQSISILANNPFCYPDADGYSGEVLAKVARTKELTKALFSTHNDPLIKEALVVLSKLHKRVELIDNDLSFIASPPCPDNRYSTEEAAAFIEETDKETAATLKKLEKELPIFKEKHGAILEDIAARIEVFSNTKDDHQGNFLQKTKDEVFDLALEPDSRAYFRKQVEAFDYKVKEHQAEMEQIKKDYEANPKLKAEAEEVIDRACAKGSNENPDVFDCVEGKGYLENFKNYIYYDNGNYWGPIAQTPDLVHYMTEFLDCPFPDNHKQLPNDDEKLICYYTLLAVVHDRFVSENTIFCEPYFFNSNGWPATLWRRIKQGDKKTQGWITRALRTVKYDIQTVMLSASKSKNGIRQFSPTEIKQNKKKTKNTKESTFQPWRNPGDACFVIDGNRIKLNYSQKLEDLQLKAESKTYRLLRLLAGGSLQASEIKEQISPGTSNKASKIVAYANKLLNEKIPMVGFVGVPSNVEFIKRDNFGSYCSSLKIHTKESFDELQWQIPQ